MAGHGNGVLENNYAPMRAVFHGHGIVAFLRFLFRIGFSTVLK